MLKLNYKYILKILPYKRLTNINRITNTNKITWWNIVNYSKLNMFYPPGFKIKEPKPSRYKMNPSNTMLGLIKNEVLLFLNNEFKF